MMRESRSMHMKSMYRHAEGLLPREPGNLHRTKLYKEHSDGLEFCRHFLRSTDGCSGQHREKGKEEGDCNGSFVPDEVFEIVEDAKETIEFLMSQYGGTEGPLVYPILLKSDCTNIASKHMLRKFVYNHV